MHKTHFFLSGWIILVLFAFPCSVEAKNEYEFARGLMEFGYLDLAKEVFSQIKNNGGLSKEERAKGELGLIQIQKAEAEKESDPDKQQQAFDVAIKGLEDFVKNYKSLKESKDAEFDLGFLLQTKGKFLTKQAERSGDSKYREIAAGALEKATALFEGIVKASEEQSEEWLKAKYYGFECWYYLGICYEKGNPKRTESLEKAIKSIEEFAWDNEGLPVAYYAYMIQGDCFVAMEKFDEAVTSYDSVCSLPADVEAAKNIRQRGFLAKSKGLVDGGRNEQAMKVIEEYFNDYKGDAERYSTMGLGVLLQQARAFGGSGDIGQALAVAQDIADRDTGYWGREAQFFITSLPIGGKLPTKTAFSIAEGHRKRGALGKAIDHYELAIMGASSNEDFEELVPKSWYSIGASYFEAELYDVAAKAFDAGASLTKGKKDLLADNAYWAMRSYQELRALTQDPAHAEAYRTARGNLTKRFSDSKHVRGGTLTFLEGIDYQKAKEYDKAINEFKKLNIEDSKYERAQVEIGVCYYKQGQDNREKPATRDEFFKKATEQFKKCIDYAKKVSLDDAEKQAERDISLANATFYTASMSADLERWEEVHKYAEEFVENPVFNKQTGLVAALYYYQVRAYCKQKKVNLDKAVEIYEKTKENPALAKSGYLGNMAQLIGIEFNKQLVDLAKQKESIKDKKKLADIEKQVAEIEPKAADYLYLSLINDRTPNPNTANTVGNLLYKVNRFKEAGEMFNIAYASKETSEKEKLVIRLKLAKCLVESERWSEALPLYRDLVEANPQQAGLLREMARTYVGLSEQKRIQSAKKLLMDLLPKTLDKEKKTAQTYSIKDQQKYITLRYPDIAEKLETDEKFNTSPLKILELIHEKRRKDASDSDGEDSETQLRHYLWREALAIYIDLGSFTPKYIADSPVDSEVNNPIWWEAKFYTPYLYEKCGNSEKAYKLAKQMQELYPSLGSDFGYKDKFEALLGRVGPK